MDLGIFWEIFFLLKIFRNVCSKCFSTSAAITPLSVNATLASARCYVVSLLGPVPSKDMQTGPLYSQKWSELYERCVMCWNEWKINFPIFVFLILWVINAFVRNFQVFLTDPNKIRHLKRCAMFWIGFSYSWFFFCAILCFWDEVDFVFNSMVNIVLTTYENLEENFAKHTVDANQWDANFFL